MSRILLATLGSLGDLHPYIAVGRELIARGQQVRLATSIDYRARVEAAGLEFAPLAPSIAELGEPEQVAQRFFDRWRGPQRLLKAMVTAPLRRAYADLRAAAEGVALAVSHPITPALPLIAASRELPWLSSVLAPYSLFSMTDPAVIPNFEWLQRLPRMGNWPHGTMLNLVRVSVRRWERPVHELRAELGPAGFDQSDNAARAARLGVGRVLSLRRAHNPARLTRELRALLGDPTHARAAVEMAEKSRGTDGAATAAQHIIDCVTAASGRDAH